MKKITLFLILPLFVFILIFSNNYLYENIKKIIPQNIKAAIPVNQKNFIKKTVFFISYINELEENIINLDIKLNTYKEKLFNKNTQTYEYEKKINYNTKYEIDIFTNKDFFVIEEKKTNRPRAYLTYTDKNIIKVTGNGNIFFTLRDIFESNNSHIVFEKIPNNFKDKFLDDESYKNKHASIVKNILISKNKIYLSYLNKENEQCYMNSIVSADYNQSYLEFTDFFKTNFCSPYFDDSSGGNMDSFNDNIILTVGDWGIYNYKNKNRYKDKNSGNPQKTDNPLGKIFIINKKTKKGKIISIGHRNPQGLFYDSESNYIYSTEHGPKGGDEVNLNKNYKIVKNFGWPISSYGEHYDYENYEHSLDTQSRYTEAPLKKSHTEHGFLEPLINFTPSIGISQILKIKELNKENKDKNFSLFIAALGNNKEEGDLSLHEYVLDENFQIINKHIIFLEDRIRDMKYLKKENIIIMFLENNGSIAILKSL